MPCARASVVSAVWDAARICLPWAITTENARSKELMEAYHRLRIVCKKSVFFSGKKVIG